MPPVNISTANGRYKRDVCEATHTHTQQWSSWLGKAVARHQSIAYHCNRRQCMHLSRRVQCATDAAVGRHCNQFHSTITRTPTWLSGLPTWWSVNQKHAGTVHITRLQRNCRPKTPSPLFTTTYQSAAWYNSFTVHISLSLPLGKLLATDKILFHITYLLCFNEQSLRMYVFLWEYVSINLCYHCNWWRLCCTVNVRSQTVSTATGLAK